MAYLITGAAADALVPASPEIPYCYYSVVGDTAIIGRRARLPPRSDHCRQEGSLRTAICFWVSMLIAGILFTAGFTITILAHAKCIEFPQVVHGSVIMLCAASLALLAAGFRIYGIW
ncbi:hypothetical protein MTO96_038619 [Rhipicephalus appendiculatus]